SRAGDRAAGRVRRRGRREGGIAGIGPAGAVQPQRQGRYRGCCRGGQCSAVLAAGAVTPYLVGLDLTGRRVVVVGAGTVAQRRLPRLVGAGADVLLVAPEATPAVEAMTTAGELRWAVRGHADGDLEGAW